jgi:hypothetical protein
MNKMPLLLLIVLAAAGACKSQEEHEKSAPKNSEQQAPLVPQWLEDQMEAWQQEGYTEVDAYYWKGDTVYLAIPPCCDRFSELYNRKGKLLCHPGGGITGKGDGKCPEFRSDATLISSLMGSEE